VTPTRRQLLVGAGSAAGLAVVAGVAGWQLPAVRRRLDPPPPAFVPDAAEGLVVLEQRASSARGRDVDLFVARPAGYDTEDGLPVVLVLHGATGRPTDYRTFGLQRFLTAAVEAGAAPFALAGADGGRLRWEPAGDGSDDPRAMLLDELPRWLLDHGLDPDRSALWGWSMGGYGALRAAQTTAGRFRAVAAFSPALASGDDVAEAAGDLAGTPVGLWCGTEDPFLPPTRELVDLLPDEPEIASFTPGRHTRAYWNDQTLEALGLLATHLAT